MMTKPPKTSIHIASLDLGFGLRFGLRFGLALLLGVWLAVPASAQTSDGENIGELAITDILVEPSFRFAEPNRGGFGVGYAYVAGTWRKDKVVSGSVKVGTLNLIGESRWYGFQTEAIETTREEIGVIEAYGQLDGDYGRLRAGFIPIPFGLEGGDVEPRLRFPRSLFFQNHMIGLRDYGVSYRIGHQGFFSDWSAHNGEGGENIDNETWLSARWGWQGGRLFRLGFSGTTGRTSPEATNPRALTGTDLADLSARTGINVNLPSKIRLGNAFLEWQSGALRVEGQASFGDVIQEDRQLRPRAFNLDLELATSETLSWLARYDTLDLDSEIGGDLVSEVSAGLALRSRYETSVFSLIGTKRIQEGVSPDQHRVLLLWRLTPSVRALRMDL